MGLQGGTAAGKGIGGLKAAVTPASKGGMWGWQATPASATGTKGIGGFFQNIGAKGASALGAPTATNMLSTPYAIPSIGDAWGSLNMLQKAGVVGIGGLAASKAGLLEQPPLQGKPTGVGELNEQQQQYLTGGLRPATTMPGVGGSPSGN